MIRTAQLMLVLAAAGLWVASRLTWMQVTTFDGLTHPQTTTVDGATWSTALVPLALLLLAAAIAVRGWPLRVLAVLVALVSAAMAYLAISQWVIGDVAARGARLAEVPVVDLVDAQRHYWGAVVTLVAAVCALVAAVLLMRVAAKAGSSAAKYATPATRRAGTRREESDDAMSERMIWDALDEGHDPTNPDSKGR